MRSARNVLAVLTSLLALGLLVVPATAQDEGTVEIDLEEIGDSGVSGTAILTEEEDGVFVEIEVSGDAVVGGHPVHIHHGTCNNLNPAPEYPLVDIDEDGLSETLVEGTTLAELQDPEHDEADQFAGWAINAHLSAEQVGTYIACGNLATGEDLDVTPEPTEEPEPEETPEPTAAAETTTTPAAGVTPAVGAGTTTAPATGVGSGVGGENNGLLIALVTLAGALMVVGVALRMRASRA